MAARQEKPQLKFPDPQETPTRGKEGCSLPHCSAHVFPNLASSPTNPCVYGKRWTEPHHTWGPGVTPLAPELEELNPLLAVAPAAARTDKARETLFPQKQRRNENEEHRPRGTQERSPDSPAGVSLPLSLLLPGVNSGGLCDRSLLRSVCAASCLRFRVNTASTTRRLQPRHRCRPLHGRASGRFGNSSLKVLLNHTALPIL